MWVLNESSASSEKLCHGLRSLTWEERAGLQGTRLVLQGRFR